MNAEKCRQRRVVRFWGKVTKIEDSGCWLWTGEISPDGYGVFHVEDRNVAAHRFSMEMFLGRELRSPGRQLAGDELVLHLCDNRLCVNPQHLTLGTQADNICDRDSKGRQSRGVDRPACKLTEDDVRKIRELYVLWKYTQVRLGLEFGVHYSVISDIILRKTWKHV